MVGVSHGNLIFNVTDACKGLFISLLGSMHVNGIHYLLVPAEADKRNQHYGRSNLRFLKSNGGEFDSAAFCMS